MKSGYVYLDENELSLIRSFVMKNKDHSSVSLLNKLKYYDDKSSNDTLKSNAKYKTLALDKIKSINEDLINNEDITFDDDALVSSDKNGAYVHAWVYVENAKPKRTRKKSA